jgi:hypothetical protein
MHEFVEGKRLGILDFDVNVDGFRELHGFSELETGLKNTLHDPPFEFAQKPNAAKPSKDVHDGGSLVHGVINFGLFRAKGQCQYAQRCTLDP